MVAGQESPSAEGEVLTYEELVRLNGAVYDRSTGQLVRIVPDGSSSPRQRPDGTWVQASEKRFVARSLEEARQKGRLWDFYAQDVKCPRQFCNQPLSGWVRGGRKFEIEHDHITAGRYGRIEEMEVPPPPDSEEKAPARAGATEA